MWDKRAQITDVHDGDTITTLLDQGFGEWLTIKVRLLGVFAPELSQPGGPECREFVKKWVLDNTGTLLWPFLVTTARTADHETTTFNRYVCTVTRVDGSGSLNVAVQDFINTNGYGGGTGS